MMRVRPVTITIHVEAVADDGDTLVPLQIEPVKLSAAQFAEFDLNAALADVEETLAAQPD